MLARLMGIQAPGILIFVGINLVGFATFLGWLSQRQAIPRPLLWGVVASDIAWVIASLIGLSFIPHQLTQIGIFLIVDVAVIVASFAIFQFIFIRRESRVTT